MMKHWLLLVVACCGGAVLADETLPAEKIRIRDPFVVADKQAGVYRLYSSIYAKKGEKSDGFGNTGFGVEMYVGRDLRTWSPAVTVLDLPKELGCTAVWAPEVHEYKGKWYLFATLTFGGTILPAANGWPRHEKRGTWIFAADRPEGPYRIVKRDSVTPSGWSSLDGTLVVEDGKPYMVFCHEWTQVTDGEMCLMPLKDDLSDAAGEPVTLFKASSAPDVAPNCLVTDGPSFCRDPETRSLVMIWSTIRKNGMYCVYQVRSESGRVAGPWEHHEMLFSDNGGHGMLFRKLDTDALTLSLHRPNGPAGAERMAFFNLGFEDGRLETDSSAATFKPVAPHPRLFADKAAFQALKLKLEQTELGRLGRARLLREADALLPLPLLERKMEGRRLLSVSRNALNRIGKLAMAYRVTGERTYAEKAVRDALAVSAFSDWNPSHFLDVGEMTLAVALARDWLDDVLVENEKRTLDEAILRKGLLGQDGRLSRGWWVRAENNWNQVCHGGLAAGALAIRDRHPAEAEATLLRARRLIPYALTAYAGGNFPEGPAAYWEYATDYTCVALDVLARAFAEIDELRDFPGLREQVDYPNFMTGPTGAFFNYSDAGATSESRRRFMYAPWALARLYDRADALKEHEEADFRAACAGKDAGGDSYRSFNRLFPLVLLTLPDGPLPAGRQTPLCRAFGGPNPLGVLRTGTGANDWYVGVKGGSPALSHGHMDVGSFVLDADGVRWACELGCEPYPRIEAMKTIDLWNMSQKSTRWDLFRLGVEGHGTLTIDGAKQRVRGFAPVTVSSAAVPSEAVVDMTSVCGGASKAVRTFRLEVGGGLRVSDRLEGLKPGAKVVWNVNTEAAAAANGNVLALTAKDAAGRVRTMTLTASPADARWDVVDVSKPRTPADSPNPGVTRVRFTRTAPADGVLDFAVSFATGD